ncbi:hypothetical protein C8F04DRAFT_46883 [Mycena alexandri]|uniref:Uncharacterized protein n=1 Tax=Mycena alexandri TaxID=1745969 RepID=A0AAD6SLS5_9AGAR|nr:hypothetical protein C8F04DRAFT_46883 [Mycena alexandri]
MRCVGLLFGAMVFLRGTDRLLSVGAFSFVLLSGVRYSIAPQLRPKVCGKGLMASRKFFQLFTAHHINRQYTRVIIIDRGLTTLEVLDALATEVADNPTAEAGVGLVARGADGAVLTALRESKAASAPTDPKISLEGRKGCKMAVSVPAARRLAPEDQPEGNQESSDSYQALKKM